MKHILPIRCAKHFFQGSGYCVACDTERMISTRPPPPPEYNKRMKSKSTVVFDPTPLERGEFADHGLSARSQRFIVSVDPGFYA